MCTIGRAHTAPIICNGTESKQLTTSTYFPSLTGSLDDLHSFNLATKVWTLLNAAEVSGAWPAARNLHGFTSAGGCLYVHGGEGFNGEWYLQTILVQLK
jgi:hypothetical protein